jgi:hypothetical protein
MFVDRSAFPRSGCGSPRLGRPVWATLTAGLRRRGGICPNGPAELPWGALGRPGLLRAARQPRYGARKVTVPRPDVQHRTCGVNHGDAIAENGGSNRSADRREPNNPCTANSAPAVNRPAGADRPRRAQVGCERPEANHRRERWTSSFLTVRGCVTFLMMLE